MTKYCVESSIGESGRFNVVIRDEDNQFLGYAWCSISHVRAAAVADYLTWQESQSLDSMPKPPYIYAKDIRSEKD